MTFEVDHYYMLEALPGHHHVFGVGDVENWRTCVPLANGEVVVCAGFVHRSGKQGRGRYAKLHHQRGDKRVVLYLRVSRKDSGAGTWREIAPLEVLALADVLPTL